MNPRIRELVEQSDMITILNQHASEYGDGFFEATLYPELEMFVELIVRKCMVICEQQRLKVLNNPDDPSWIEHLTECQNAMQQMFLNS